MLHGMVENGLLERGKITKVAKSFGVSSQLVTRMCCRRARDEISGEINLIVELARVRNCRKKLNVELARARNRRKN